MQRIQKGVDVRERIGVVRYGSIQFAVVYYLTRFLLCCGVMLAIHYEHWGSPRGVTRLYHSSLKHGIHRWLQKLEISGGQLESFLADWRGASRYVYRGYLAGLF